MQSTLKYILLFFAIYSFYYYIFYQIDFFELRDPLLIELKKQLSVLHPRFKDVEIYEGNKSYTLNKKRVYICLKDDKGRYYNRNMLVYVICHEYAHMLCKDIGHEGEFPEIFDQLLQRASKLGLYNPSIPPIENYCGHN